MNFWSETIWTKNRKWYIRKNEKEKRIIQVSASLVFANYRTGKITLDDGVIKKKIEISPLMRVLAKSTIQ